MTTRAARRRRACARLVGVAPARRLAPRIPTTSADVSATEPRPRRGPTWRRSSCQRPHDVLISPLHSPGARPRIVWLFSMVLGYSRLIWARFVLHQDLQSVLRCHIAALEALGGVPREILYDRM